MSQPVNSGNPNSPKEMSMEVRLLIAFLLMAVVMFVAPIFFKTPPPPPGQKTTAPAPASTAGNAGGAHTPAPAAPSVVEAAAPALPSTAQHPQPPFVIDTDLFRVVLSNQGGNVRSWQLKKYRGNDGKWLELVN